MKIKKLTENMDNMPNPEDLVATVPYPMKKAVIDSKKKEEEVKELVDPMERKKVQPFLGTADDIKGSKEQPLPEDVIVPDSPKESLDESLFSMVEDTGRGELEGTGITFRYNPIGEEVVTEGLSWDYQLEENFNAVFEAVKALDESYNSGNIKKALLKSYKEILEYCGGDLDEEELEELIAEVDECDEEDEDAIMELVEKFFDYADENKIFVSTDEE